MINVRVTCYIAISMSPSLLYIAYADRKAHGKKAPYTGANYIDLQKRVYNKSFAGPSEEVLRVCM